MTEHERRVNDEQIRAYQGEQTNSSATMLPGLGNSYGNMQQKFMNKGLVHASVGDLRA